MKVDFWLQKWANNETAFHHHKANPLLVEHFKALHVESGSRVFLPLCGKTLDIAWLLEQGYRVAGAELSKKAIEQLFDELGKTPAITPLGDLKHYGADNLDIFVGDIFHLSPERLGPVDAVYDRAALVALPEGMRARYTAHLMAITDKAPQLLLTFVYDQNAMEGPPFSIPGEEVHQHYGNSYDVALLASQEVPGGLKGLCAAQDQVWLLTPSNG